MSDAAQIVRLAERIGRLEQMVEHLYAELRIQRPPDRDPGREASPQVLDLIRAGDRMGAIRQLRAETGCDLATATERVKVLSG